MELKLDSDDKITSDEIAEIEKYFSQISLSELLVVNRIANEEINHRIDKFDSRTN